MSVDSVLDGAFALLLQKARPAQGELATPATRPATLLFEWAGGGSALTAAATDPLLIEIPFPCRIIWAHLYAGSATGAPVAVTTTLDVQLTRWESFGGSTPLYGSGLSPRITADSLANMDLSGWQTHLVTGDTLIARVLTFSGLATWLAMSLLVRPTDVPIGVGGVVDDSGNPVVDDAGNPVVLRS